METDHNKLEGDLTFDGGRGVTHDEGRQGDWMQTWTGRRFYPADPRAADVDVLDIIFSLSNCTRYNGHCRRYSIMEHSLLVSSLVPVEYAKEGFAHDFAETYIADMIRPIKRVLGKANDYFKLEDSIWRLAICPAFGLDPELPKSVTEMDTAICVLERRVLHPRADEWHLPFPEPKATIRCFAPMDAMRRGLQRFSELWHVDLKALQDRFFTLVQQDTFRFQQHQIEIWPAQLGEPA